MTLVRNSGWRSSRRTIIGAVGAVSVCVMAPTASAQWTVVNLQPAGGTSSSAYGVGGGQQVGYAHVMGGAINSASLWSGTAASWVDLHPAGATYSSAYGVGGGQQVGYAAVGGANRASLWSGTAASWVDLQPAGALLSYANSVFGAQQVGGANVGSAWHASLWRENVPSAVESGRRR